jgi:hypothetical protein
MGGSGIKMRLLRSALRLGRKSWDHRRMTNCVRQECVINPRVSPSILSALVFDQLRDRPIHAMLEYFIQLLVIAIEPI